MMRVISANPHPGSLSLADPPQNSLRSWGRDKKSARS
jgi:hypothetical protein